MGLVKWRKTYAEVRLARWWAPDDLHSSGYRPLSMHKDYNKADCDGKMAIWIINNRSNINPCHKHCKHRVEDGKRRVLQADGCPLELPALSQLENFVKPNTLLYRNMLAMLAEEVICSHSVDGAVGMAR